MPPFDESDHGTLGADCEGGNLLAFAHDPRGLRRAVGAKPGCEMPRCLGEALAPAARADLHGALRTFAQRLEAFSTALSLRSQRRRIETSGAAQKLRVMDVGVRLQCARQAFGSAVEPLAHARKQR